MKFSAPSVLIRHVYLTYGNQTLFQDFNLTLSSGKCTCLLGPSGVGKSSLLHVIANLIPYQGQITLDTGQLISSHVAYMGQTDLLMPWLTALENALLSWRLKGNLTKHNVDQAKQLFKQLDLKNIETKYPWQLSGGMRQRVALARTLLQDKPIVLMDEPFSALDAITRFQLQTLSASLLKDRTVLLVTHDPMEALRLADEIYVMSGQPATLSHSIILTAPTPRDPGDGDLIYHHAKLFHELTKAKEAST